MVTLIKKINKEKNYIKIVWSDSQVSKFHFLWLRDNCPSNEHIHARQKIFNIIDVSEKIFPKKYFINKKDNLQIEWSEKRHISNFPLKWLKKNCYTIKNKKKRNASYKLWQSNFKKNLSNIKIHHDDILNNDDALIQWLELLIKYGFAIIKHAPIEKKSCFKILSRISHIRETFFKTPFEVINIPKPNNAAYTSAELFNHTDLPYFEYSPGYQFLHCLSNDAKGGNSSIVDGFAVAEYIKKKDKKTYNKLINTPVKFKDNDYTQNKTRIYYSPIINLDQYKFYKTIKFNMATTGILDIHPNKMSEFYLAYRKFAYFTHHKNFTINFKLKAGDILSFNNRRILHGRTAFNPNSGRRHLQGYYMDHDEIISRLNFLKKINI